MSLTQGVIDPADVALAASLVAGLVEVCKRAGMPRRWSGLFAVVLGLLCGAAITGLHPDTLFGGLSIGLAAAGLYDRVTDVVAPSSPETPPHGPNG